jgi:hypothetical protein
MMQDGHEDLSKIPYLLAHCSHAEFIDESAAL